MLCDRLVKLVDRKDFKVEIKQEDPDLPAPVAKKFKLSLDSKNSGNIRSSCVLTPTESLFYSYLHSAEQNDTAIVRSVE